MKPWSERSEAEQKKSPLKALHDLFTKMPRRTTQEPGRHVNMKRRIARAIAAKWQRGESERRAQVACCAGCRSWFQTTAERNHHRAEACA